jgi:hypothetical protein
MQVEDLLILLININMELDEKMGTEVTRLVTSKLFLSNKYLNTTFNEKLMVGHERDMKLTGMV